MKNILDIISNVVFNEGAKTCLLGMLFFSAGLGIGYYVQVTILLLYFVLYFGKNQVDQIIGNRQAWIISLIILSAPTLFIGTGYSNYTGIEAWRNQAIVFLSHLSALCIILSGENKKRIPLYVTSFLAGMVTYVISILFFEIFFYQLEYSWELLLNPFAWDLRSSGYFIKRIYPSVLVLASCYFLYLTRELVHFIKTPVNKSARVIHAGVLYFILGMGIPQAFGYAFPVFFALSYAILYLKPKELPGYLKSPSFNKITLAIYLLSTVYFASVLSLIHIKFQMSDTDRRLILSFLYLNIFMLTILFEDKRFLKHLILIFLLGTWSYSAIVVGYSAWLDMVEYGYKNLYNPFLGRTETSPIHSNFLALGFCAGLTAFVLTNKVSARIFFTFVMFISMLSILTIMGRTFLIVTTISAFIMLIINRKSNAFIPLAFSVSSSCLGTILTYLYVIPEEAVARFDIMMLQRISKLLDPANPRYLLWIDGIKQIFNSPYGGFIPENYIVSSNSFHNLWIDTVRFSGIIPLFILIAINCISLYLLFRSRKGNRLLSLAFLLVPCVMILSQELVLDSPNITTLYAYLMITFFLSANLYKTQAQS